MSNDLAKFTAPLSAIEKLVVSNDLSNLSAQQRWDYYRYRCQSIGLDPAARPFQYIAFQGKLGLYADKGCAEQLRALHKISVKLEPGRVDSGIYIVTAHASTPDGRTFTDVGAVPVEHAKGADLAKAIKVAVTQANRRATLGLMGLGEVDISDMDGQSPIDMTVMHKGAEAASVVATPEPAALPAPTEQPASDAPESWVDSAKWPSDNIDETVATIERVDAKDGTTAGKKWTKVMVGCTDDAGDFAAIAWSTTAEAVARKYIGRKAMLTICDVPNKGIKLLAIKPHAAASAPTPATSAPMADGDLPF